MVCWWVAVSSSRTPAKPFQVTRKTRSASVRAGTKGRWRAETVYAITDLGPHQARPAELAAWIHGQWQIENGLHWVRDVTFAENLSQVRTGAAPQVMATLPGDQPAPPRRRHQHRRRAAKSRLEPTPTTELTLIKIT